MRVLITDHKWDSIECERQVLEGAGLTVVEAPSPDEDTLRALARDADAIMASLAPVTRAVIEAAPRLQVIAKYGIGVDNIDVRAASARGVTVINVPDYCTDEVAEHALALLLACARGVVRYDREVRAGNWSLAAAAPLFRIHGRVLGLIGIGRIGTRLADKARGLGLEIIAYDPYLESAAVPAAGVRVVTFDQVVAQADFISLHAPLTPATQHVIDAAVLRRMKSTAILINTARGGLVDVAALARALREGWIAAAGLDVFPDEPLPLDHPLRALENVVLTPHVAFYSEEALAGLQERTAQAVVAALRGEPLEHVVNRAELGGCVGESDV